MLSQKAEAVCVVDKDAERILGLEGNYFVQFAQGTGHAVNTLGDQQHTAAALVSLFASAGKDPLAVGHVVVAVFVLAAGVQANSVQQAGVSLIVVHYHVVPRGETVDGGHNALIAEVEKECILFTLEVGEHLLQLLVILGMA